MRINNYSLCLDNKRKTGPLPQCQDRLVRYDLPPVCPIVSLCSSACRSRGSRRPFLIPLSVVGRSAFPEDNTVDTIGGQRKIVKADADGIG